MLTKQQFKEEKADWERTKQERWKYVSESYGKSMRIRPLNKGLYLGGMIRTAIVSVPPSITNLLCKEDLAMLVAGGTDYASYRIVKKSYSNVIETEVPAGELMEFIVTVIMDIENAEPPRNILGLERTS